MIASMNEGGLMDYKIATELLAPCGLYCGVYLMICLCIASNVGLETAW